MDTVNIKKYFYQILSIFAALLLAFSIAQIPVQAAAKPGTVKLSSIKALGRGFSGILVEIAGK